MEICNIMKIVYTHGIKQHGSHFVSGCFPFDQKILVHIELLKVYMQWPMKQQFQVFSEERNTLQGN